MSTVELPEWIRTPQMAAELLCHPNTLTRMRQNGAFREGWHFRKVNPLSARSTFLWHRERTKQILQAA